MKTFERIADLEPLVGQSVATSEWITIDQPMIDAFARLTFDEQWIHCDPERAARGPFGRTIAHGFLTVSLLSAMTHSAFKFAHTRMGINSGFDRLRLITPVPVGGRIRAHFTLGEFELRKPRGAKLGFDVTVELEGDAKPACVARWVVYQFE